MIGPDVVKKLAELSRLSLTEEEVAKLQGEITAIVSYIDTIQKVDLPKVPVGSVYLDQENVMREDGEPIEAGKYTEALTAQFPKRDGDYLKVKRIIG